MNIRLRPKITRRIIIALFTILILVIIINVKMSTQITDIVEYFPEMSGDLSKVTWGHAVNSKKDLQMHLDDDSIMMLEADIVMGHLNGEENTERIPIMAHPPQNTSDISLEMWMDQVIKTVKEKNVLKGVKLDFKEIEAVTSSLKFLQKQRPEITFPFLLNADILAGPGSPSTKPVDADTFLNVCSEFFPEATLSIGWTTQFNSASDPSGKYTKAMVDEMIDKLDSNSISQPVTFPIRAAFVGPSVDALEHLIDNVGDATFSIWSSPADTVDVEALVHLRDLIGHDIVYYDLPPEQQKEFNIAKADEPDQTLPTSKSSSITTSFFAILFIVIALSAQFFIFSQ